MVPITIALAMLASCSGSGEATTRKEQEQEFTNAFGFAPPSAIASIEYADAYSRGVMDGAYGQWMAFTYDAGTFGIIVAGGYEPDSQSSLPGSASAPAWWPKALPGGTSTYTRDQDDTPVNEGFSFRENIWHDAGSGKVYFHKIYWD